MAETTYRSVVTQRNSMLQFFKQCGSQLSYQLYIVFFTLLVFLLMTAFYNVKVESFYDELQMLTGTDYRNYDLSLKKRSQLSQSYHQLCKTYHLRRDFNTDYLIFRLLERYSIENVYIPLYQSYFGHLYFYHSGTYVSLT